MKIGFHLLFLLGFSSLLKSQALTVTNSTEQSWAGGVCCATGTNYQIQLKVTEADKKFKLDTLWIGDRPFVLDEKNGYSVIKSERDGALYYTLNAGVSENRYERDYELDLKKEIKEVKEITKAPKYSGVACIVYTDNNKMKKLIEISDFKEKSFLAYP